MMVKEDQIIQIVAKKMTGSFQESFRECHCHCSNEQDRNVKHFRVWPDETYADFMRTLCTYLEKLTGSFQIDVDSFVSAFDQVPQELVLAGLVFATNYAHCIPYSKKTIDKQIPPKFSFSTKIDDKIVKENENLAEVVNEVRRLQDIPSDLLFPVTFVDEIKQLCSKLTEITIETFDKEKLKKMGMNLLLAVNRGSKRQPRLLVLKYLANPDSKEVYSLVGKGITFDSGGMNIKTGSYMSTMKFDMSGAAIACGTLIALAKNHVKTNAIAVAALTENAIGPRAVRPDDIVVSYDGKTVQIDNTDAEGRLVLADAIAYVRKNCHVTRIYDIATLTGAIGICFGDVYTGVWSTCDMIWSDFKQAANVAGELVWRMPLHPEYRKVLETKLADMSNISNRSYFAGSSVAAAFLNEFRGEVPLVHLDIAYTALSHDKTGTGVMIRTLYQVCKNQK